MRTARDMDPQYDGFPRAIPTKTFNECPYCCRVYEPDTVSKLNREKLPCPCGTPTAEFHAFVAPENTPAVGWDEVVDEIATSGLWRCTGCGFTAAGSEWDHQQYGDECISECPDCRAVEDYEVLKMESK